MKAVCTWSSQFSDECLINLNGHEFGFGGQGDGYCYSHQDFACLDSLTDEESTALKDIDYADQ